MAKVNTKDYPETLTAVRQSAAGLNDPTIGGMYDRAGGQFMLDEQKQMFFLVRDFTLSQIDEATFTKQVDALNEYQKFGLQSGLHRCGSGPWCEAKAYAAHRP